MNIEFFPVMRHRYLPERSCYVCTEGRGTCWPAEKTPVSVCGDQRHALHKICAIQSLSAKQDAQTRLCDLCRRKLSLATWNSTPASQRIILQLGQQPVPSLSDRISRWVERHPILALVSLLGLGTLLGAVYAVIYTGFPFAGGWSFWLNRGKTETPDKPGKLCEAEIAELSRIKAKLARLQAATTQTRLKAQRYCESNNDIWKLSEDGESGYCKPTPYREPEGEVDRREREACEQSGDQWVTLSDHTNIGYCNSQYKAAERVSKLYTDAEPSLVEQYRECEGNGNIWRSFGKGEGYCDKRNEECEESGGKWTSVDDASFRSKGYCSGEKTEYDALEHSENRKKKNECEQAGGYWKPLRWGEADAVHSRGYCLDKTQIKTTKKASTTCPGLDKDEVLKTHLKTACSEKPVRQLAVFQTTDPNQIRKKMRKWSSLIHPDKNNNHPACLELMQCLGLAKDPDLYSISDEKSAWVREFFNAEFGAPPYPDPRSSED